ncbi:hypothetical protein B0H13DRAFT_2301284 [Mycena leptocephala]|nr:hypothetical protein B0H13DRAFT_2301284 [Mycena leptocephala]
MSFGFHTGILSNPNNEMSHRMSRSSQRQTATARKARESSSGRVRTARERAEPIPAHATQSDDMPTPTAVAEPSMPEYTAGAQPPLPEFNSAEPATGSAFDFNMFMGTPNVEVPNTGSLFSLQDFNSANLSTFDATFFAPAAESSNALIPSNSSAPTADPLVDFMNLHGFSDIFSDLSGPTDFSAFTSVPPSDPWPLLPLPPPESPPAPSAAERASEPGRSVPKQRRSRQEVDEANILHSTRSRAPTERKRAARLTSSTTYIVPPPQLHRLRSRTKPKFFPANSTQSTCYRLKAHN